MPLIFLLLFCNNIEAIAASYNFLLVAKNHVLSVENKAKVNIGVNGVCVMSVKSNCCNNIKAIAASNDFLLVNEHHVMCVENKVRTNIGANGVHVMSVKHRLKLSLSYSERMLLL